MTLMGRTSGEKTSADQGQRDAPVWKKNKRGATAELLMTYEEGTGE